MPPPNRTAGSRHGRPACSRCRSGWPDRGQGGRAGFRVGGRRRVSLRGYPTTEGASKGRAMLWRGGGKSLLSCPFSQGVSHSMRQGGRQKRLAGKLRFASFLPSGLARCCLSQESETWFRLCGAPISAGFANVSTTARASKSGRRSPLWDKKREQQGRLIQIGRANV